MIEESEPFALTGVVVVEVLQGLTKDSGPIERFLAECDMLEPAGFETYRGAAAIYRAARAQGISLTTIDTLIAAVAMEHGASVFTLDQDFLRITPHHQLGALPLLSSSVCPFRHVSAESGGN